MSETRETCETCRFWDAVESVNGTADCRRYPPSPGAWVPTGEGAMSWAVATRPMTWLSAVLCSTGPKRKPKPEPTFSRVSKGRR